MGRKEKHRMIKTIGFNLLVFIVKMESYCWVVCNSPPTHLGLPSVGSKGVRTTPGRFKYSLRIAALAASSYWSSVCRPHHDYCDDSFSFSSSVLLSLWVSAFFTNTCEVTDREGDTNHSGAVVQPCHHKRLN